MENTPSENELVFHVKSPLFVPNLHIVCASLATQHARCHKEYYSPRGKPSLRVTSGVSCGGDSRQRSEFVNFDALARRRSRFFVKFRHLRLATCIDSLQTPQVKPCHGSNFFHSLWIELRFCMRQTIISETVGKLLPTKTNWFFHVKSSLFVPKKYI